MMVMAALRAQGGGGRQRTYRGEMTKATSSNTSRATLASTHIGHRRRSRHRYRRVQGRGLGGEGTPPPPPPRRRITVDVRAAASCLSIGESLRAAQTSGKRAGFIPFVTAGDGPRGIETTMECLSLLARRGADVIELGVPYSDPLADGPVIQAASARALSRENVSLRSVLEALKSFLDREENSGFQTPVVVFTYINPVLRMGVANFFAMAAESGAKGVLLPDLPLEESERFSAAAKENGLDLVLLATPTTPPERMRKIAEAGSGFTYLVSVTGVTGARDAIEARVPALVREMKEAAKEAAEKKGEREPMPVAVGFGVGSGETASKVIGYGADAVIVGSALVRALGEAENEEEAMRNFEAIVTDIASACSGNA